jgi:hypothetical protein
MKKIFFILLATAGIYAGNAQEVLITRQGKVSFFGKTPLENIDAINNEASSALNTKTGEIGFAVLIKGFHFEKALMEEHFNENYMESDKIPKANFKGKINNLSSVDLTKDGSYTVTVDGNLTIHGVTQKVSVPGTIVVKSGMPEVTAKFNVAPKDYNIKIPSIVADKIAESMNVSVDCKYEKK